MRIPARYSPIVFGALLSAIMVAIVSAFVIISTQGIHAHSHAGSHGGISCSSHQIEELDMFLRRDYRDRALGLVAAFTVLIAGVLVTDSLTAAEVNVSPADAVHAVNLTGSRCDVVC